MARVQAPASRSSSGRREVPMKIRRSRENLRPATLATTIGVLSAALVQSACVWVSLTSGGEQVRLLEPVEVADCRRVGSTTSQTTDRVLIFARVDRTVNEEVRSLARNEAAQMGGDGIVPRGPLERGRQSFDVYRCSPSLSDENEALGHSPVREGAAAEERR